LRAHNLDQLLSKASFSIYADLRFTRYSIFLLFVSPSFCFSLAFIFLYLFLTLCFYYPFFLSFSDSLFLYFSVSLFFCFSVFLFLCFYVSLFLCFSVSNFLSFSLSLSGHISNKIRFEECGSNLVLRYLNLDNFLLITRHSTMSNEKELDFSWRFYALVQIRVS
jgi:hypothetical protein